MKRLNKFLKIAILGLLSLVAVDGTAQTKTVKYTFTGRNSSPMGILVKGKDLDMKASQDVPKGVAVDAISGIEYEDGKDGADEDTYKDVQLGAVMGIALLPQYVVKPQTTATIQFSGFRYEIKHIDWTFRTQIPLISSTANTWAKEWSSTSTDKREWSFTDSPEEDNRSAWQFAFHRHTFFDEIKDGGPLMGLLTLNVECTSKMALHGIAMQDFYITYYEPQITFLGTSDKTIADVGYSGTVNVKFSHLGAFHVDEVVFENVDTKSAFDNSTKSIGAPDANNDVTASINLNGLEKGVSKICVKLISNDIPGEDKVIAKSYYQVRIGPEPEWVWVAGDIYSEDLGANDPPNRDRSSDWFKPNTDGNFVNKDPARQTWPSDNRLKLDGSVFSGDPINVSAGEISKIHSSESNGNHRTGLQSVVYKQVVPKYAKIEVTYTYYGERTKTSSANNRNCGFELNDLGSVQGTEFPDNKCIFISTNFNTNHNVSSYPKDGNGTYWGNTVVRNQGTANGTISETLDYSFTLNNSTQSDRSSMQENFAFWIFLARIDNGNNTAAQLSGYAKATNRRINVTYYSTVTFDPNYGDGATGTSGTMAPKPYEVSTGTKTTDQTFIVPAVDLDNKLSNNTYTWTNHKFMGWNSNKNKADEGIVEYKDGDVYFPFDTEDAGGIGPKTLYAVWKDISPATPTTPEELADRNTFALYANGGQFRSAVAATSLGSEEVFADFFTYGTTVAGINSYTPSIGGGPLSLIPTMAGYTFKGFYDNADGGNQVFSNTGAPVNDGEIIFQGKWIAEDNVTLYAQWQEITSGGDMIPSFTITLNPNGGAFGDSDPTKEIQVKAGSTQNNNVAAYTPTKTNSTFVGWYYEQREKLVPVSEKYANWTEFRDAHGSTSGNTITINSNTFSDNGDRYSGFTKIPIWTTAPDEYVDMDPSEYVVGPMVYNQNGESVKLVGYLGAPGSETPQFEVVNSNTFGINGKYVGTVAPYNDNFTLYAHWIDSDIEVHFHEGGTGSNSANYKEATEANLSTAPEKHFNTTPTYEEAEYSVVSLTRAMKDNVNEEDAWNTVCFPFDVYKNQVDLLFKEVRKLNGISVQGENISMQFVQCSEMIAGVPYFVKLKDSPNTDTAKDAYIETVSGANMKKMTFKEVALSRTPGTVTLPTTSGVDLIMYGNFNTALHIGDNAALYPLKNQGYDYYYLQNNNFYKSGGEYILEGQTEKKTVWGNNKGFRIYFAVKNGSLGSKALSFSLNLEDLEDWMGEDAIITLSNDDSEASMTSIYDLSGRQLMGKPQHGLYIVNGKKYIVK